MQHPNKIKFYEARKAMQVCNTNSNVGPNIVNQMIPFYNMDKSCMLLFTATVKPSSIKYIQFTHTHTSLPLSLSIPHSFSPLSLTVWSNCPTHSQTLCTHSLILTYFLFAFPPRQTSLWGEGVCDKTKNDIDTSRDRNSEYLKSQTSLTPQT